MKNLLTKAFGFIGLIIYYILSTIIRIPVGLFLLAYMVMILLIFKPILRIDYEPKWLNRLYDWYCGE